MKRVLLFFRHRLVSSVLLRTGEAELAQAEQNRQIAIALIPRES